MFRTLYSRLATVLLGLFALVGVVSVVATLHFFELYNEESTQRLNQPLARHLADQLSLLSLADANPERLHSMFDMQMIVNPSIQIYLLDAAGHIVAHSASLGEVKLKQVDLAPVAAFLNHTQNFPLRGEDPLDPQRRRIFSVARIGSSATVQGYLYVVLASGPAGLAALLRGSDIIPVAAGVAGLSVVLALLVGLAIFAAMTRKLERLAAAMDEFQHMDARSRPEAAPPLVKAGGGDEIDRLAFTFREMAARITAQLERLRQTDQLRRELVANVSHDLKTPIATLQGYVDTLLLKDSGLSAEEDRKSTRLNSSHLG